MSITLRGVSAGYGSTEVLREVTLVVPDGAVVALLGPNRAVDAFPLLGSKLAQTAGTMSGGEQQMLALARSYLRNPAYVLLDEVSMGLAPKVVDEIFDYLTRLAATGVALLLVEQYVHKAL